MSAFFETHTILNTAQQEQAFERLTHLFEHAQARVASLWSERAAKNLKCPALQFNQRGKVAASALLQKNVVRINPHLYEHNNAYYISDVIAHELAHILVHQLYRNRLKPHGAEWQHIMIHVFGIEPKVTHQLDVSEVAMKTFRYSCGCQQIDLSLIRHNKIVRGKQSYICKKCAQTFIRAIEE